MTEAVEDTEAALVVALCRRLDGVPLAIELVAGRVPSFGLRETASLLDERLALSWTGRRTAPARQKTLQATLDWSYRLLSDKERSVLRRLAVFVGHFSIEAVLAVVADAKLVESQVLEAVDGLVTKSIVATRPTGSQMRYRLPDVTRTYIIAQSTEDEVRITSARHAMYYLSWLERTGERWPSLLSVPERSRHLSSLANARKAMEWCFDTSGDVQLGKKMTVAAVPVFLSMSLLEECQSVAARAGIDAMSINQ